MTRRFATGALGPATAVGLVVFAWAAFVLAPTDRAQGQVQRIFYGHLPSAWVSFLAFALVCGASIAYLATRNERWDGLAAACAEVGMLFTSAVLLTGMIWARAVWGVYWAWDPRLTSFLVLWLLYGAYLVLRGQVVGVERRARLSAVMGIVAFLDVPLVYLSVTWWRTMHPQPMIVVEGGPRMPGVMVVALVVGLVSFSLLFAYLVRLRLQVTALDLALEEEAPA
jgi:heme exporter protein C